MKEIITANTDFIPGYTITQVLKVVKGNTIRAKHVGRDIMAALKQVIGGEIKGYTEMFIEARNEAEQRMLDEALSIGADAVINVRYSTSAIMIGASEILVYGTAVKLQNHE